MLTLKKSAKRIRLSASGKVSPFRNWTEIFDLFPCPELHLSALIRRLCAEHESLIAPFLTPPEKYHIEFIALYNHYTEKSVKRNTYIKKTVNYTARTKILVRSSVRTKILVKRSAHTKILVKRSARTKILVRSDA